MVDYNRLYTAVMESRRAMEPIRNTRLKATQQLVGRHYSDSSASDRVPINLMELATTVYSKNLVSQRPQVLVTTNTPAYKPSSVLLELATNHYLKKMNFGKLLSRSVVEALFGLGAVKVGRDSNGDLFCDRIDLDNYYVDLRATGRDTIQWEGDRYVMLLDDAVKRYGDKVKKYGSQMQSHSGNRSLNEQGDERTKTVSGMQWSSESAVDDVELLDIYIPSEKKIYTFPAPQSGAVDTGDWTEALDVVDWVGPENGPYHVLGFSDVPGNVLPSPPASQWLDLHELANELFRKLGRQATRQKEVTAVQTGNTEDAAAVRNSSDGDIIPLNDPKSAQILRFGGADQVGLAFFLQVKEMYSWMGGNLDALGGLSAQSSTATQDSLLHESASKRMAAMQSDVLDFTAAVVRDIAWWIWEDKSKELDLIRTVGDLNIEIPVRWTEQSRKGDFLDYTFEIEPYSMQYMTPGAKAQAIIGLWNQVLLPGAQFGQQQGVQPNMSGMLRTLGKMMNLPEVEDTISFTEPMGIPGQPSAGSASDLAMNNAAMGARTATGATERRYVRENVPTGGTPQGRTAVAMQQLLGGNPQPKQAAASGLGTTEARS